MTGLVSFTVGVPEGWPLFWLHRALGIGIVALLAWKLARVGRRLTDPSLWRRSTALSVLTLVAALGTLATGIVWVFARRATLLLDPPLRPRRVRPRARPACSRRARGDSVPAPATGRLRAAAHRDTLHRPAGRGRGDVPPPAGRQRRARHGRLRPEIHRVTAAGGRGERRVPDHLVGRRRPRPDRPRTLPTDGRRLVVDPIALNASDRRRATRRRPCSTAPAAGTRSKSGAGSASATSTRRPAGRGRGETPGADSDREPAYVRFTSVTGYRWSLPIEEAEDALLATHVGGERLSHGHGAPARLVAPDRRGFQWVKWVTRVEVRSEYDLGQWVVTLVSGFE